MNTVKPNRIFVLLPATIPAAIFILHLASLYSRADTFVTPQGTVEGRLVGTALSTTTIVQTFTTTTLMTGTNTSTDQSTWTLFRGRRGRAVQPGTPGSAITNQNSGNGQ
jgi:hypothetical protein